MQPVSRGNINTFEMHGAPHQYPRKDMQVELVAVLSPLTFINQQLGRHCSDANKLLGEVSTVPPALLVH